MGSAWVSSTASSPRLRRSLASISRLAWLDWPASPRCRGDDRVLGRGGDDRSSADRWVLVDAHQLDAALGQHGVGVLIPGQAVQAGIETDPGA